jgi:molecular chaperone HscA
MANIGIDLGTTHSLVAVVLGGKARCLLDDDERTLLPSAVRYGDDGVPTAVGYPALALAGAPDGVTFTSVKRFMGRAPAEVAAEADLFKYALDETDDRVVRFRVGERAVTPMEISSFILRLLHSRAEECLFGRPGGAVITVPAYFDDAQRQATRDAARLAGIEVLRLLNEPTAAALAYGLDKAQTGQKVAVYDLGGGTFDISILDLDEGVFQVLSTAGDTRLGGDDFDQALAALLLQQVGLSDPDGPTFRTAIRAAEAAKRALTDAEETTISVELAGQKVEAGLDRATFEALIRPIVQRTADACRQALSDAGLQPGDIDEVVLVGGSTRVPMVRRYVEELFERAPHTEQDPDQVVALGAAIQADILSGKSELADDMLLVDVVPLSLGIEVMGGLTERLIPRTTAIPANASQTFTTHVDGQTAVDIHVVQGERELVKDNRSLARFKLRGLPAMAAGIPRVRVDFTVDANGILSVSATEEGTGRTASVDVQPTYGLTDDEIEDMLEDAIDHAEEDIDERLLIAARVEGEQILHHITKALNNDADLLEGDEGPLLTALSADLKASLSGTDRQRIRELGNQVDERSAAFAQRRIERDLALAIGGKGTDEVAEALGLR